MLVNYTSQVGGIGQIYPNRIHPWPNRMFLENNETFVFNCDMSDRIFAADLGLLELFFVKDRTGKVLDVLDDTILTLHNSVEHGQELRMGTLVDEDMDPTTTTTTIITTTSTATASLTTVTTDPCQEVLDIIKQKDEIIRNLTQQQEVDAQEEMPETTTATASDTQASDAPVGPTTLYPLIADTTTIVLDIITATVAPGDLDYVDMTEEKTEAEPPRHQGLRKVKMETRTVLSYNPYKGVVSETKLHQD